jgi:hypothetical protein
MTKPEQKRQKAGKDCTPEELAAWADKNYVSVHDGASDAELERKLRYVCVQGAAFAEGYAVGTNRTLALIRGQGHLSIYYTYFMRGAKADKLGADNFRTIASKGGLRFTNEYQYCSLLMDFVDDEVLGKSMRLVKGYGGELI